MSGARKLLVGLGLTLLLALGAAACGGDSDDSGAESVAPTAVTAPSAPREAPAPPTISPPETSTFTEAAAATGRTGDEKLAPELRGIASWINSDPLTLEGQRGKVVLIDFWTYTCINCIRTLPYLTEWHDKYVDEGLVIVGVHTPEFDFEHIRENVVEAAAGFGIEYAIAQDNDYGTWNAFQNRFWPAKYLIDKDGYVRYTHFGEGAYDETEQKIRELLAETGGDLSGISRVSEPEPVFHPSARTTDSAKRLTRELYAGYGRNYSVLQSQTAPPYVLHVEYYETPDADVLYEDPGEHQNHFIYLNGLWRNTEESLVHARETESHEDYIAINFYATSANAVMASEELKSSKVRLTIDGAPVDPGLAGADVMFDEDGNSYVQVRESRMYRLIDTPTFGGRELKLSPNSEGVSIFAFTFGAYTGGEPDS